LLIIYTNIAAPCTLSDGMAEPKVILDSWITGSPDVTNPALARPNSGDYWRVPIESNPRLEIRLVDSGFSTSPVLVDRLILQSNVILYSVQYKTDDLSPNWEVVTENGMPKVSLLVITLLFMIQ